MRRRLLMAMAVAVVTGIVTAAPSTAAPEDPMVDLQWALRTIGADPGGPHGGTGVTVAVMDTGVKADHEDLQGAVAASVDCIGAAGDPAACRPTTGDDDGHGTHVAGLAAARARNGKGITGVAPRATLQSVRVLARACEDKAVGGVVCTAVGDSSDVEAGIRWAVGAGADVINLSVADDAVGRAAMGSPLGHVIEEAWAAGVVVVVAAGNDLDVAMGAGYEDVPAIVVAATGRGDQKPVYSNSVGTARWGLAAPGGDDNGACPTNAVLSTWVRSRAPNEDYACMGGTSMAAPHVAGAAAVLLSAGFTPAQAVEQLLRTAVDLGDQGPDRVYGAGRLDLAAALAMPAPTIAPAVTTPLRPPSPTAAVGAGRATPATPAPEAPGPSSAAAPAAPGRRSPFSFGRLELPDWDAAKLPLALVLLAAVAIFGNTAGLVMVRRRRDAAGPRAMTPL